MLILIFLTLLFNPADNSGQDLHQVGKTQADKERERIVLLEEVFRIHDNRRDIIFKNPRSFSRLEDGSILFWDYPFLYKYDEKGNFIFRIFNLGNGPGESKRPDDYYFDGEKIYIYSWIPPKIMAFDLDGNFIEEQEAPPNTFVYVGYIDNRIFGIRDEIRYSEFIQQEGFFETPFTIYEISSDFKEQNKIFGIPVQHYIKNSHWWRRVIFTVVPHEHYLFILHTSEYQVDKLDLRTGQIERTITRSYERKKYQENKNIPDIYNPVPKKLLPPQFEYVWDIWWIQVANNSLYVFTSTLKEGSRLIDVFDMEGNYIDAFYLQFPDNSRNHNPIHSLLTEDGFLFVPEENNETGLVSIGKYKIKNE